MRIGITGYSGSGKTTVFQLLTGAKPDPSGRPGQVAVAQIIDPRLDLLVSIYQPKKVVHAHVEFVDLAGLSKTDHSVNPGRLAALREADCMLVVIGAYAAEQGIPAGGPTAGAAIPAGGSTGGAGIPACQFVEAEIRSFDDDLLLADLQLVSDRIQKLEHALKKPKPDRDADLHQIELLRPIRDALEQGKPLRDQTLSPEQDRLIRAAQPLTLKPRLTLINLPESASAPSPSSLTPSPSALAVPAKLELELQQLDPADRQTFMAELGLSELSRDRLLLDIHARLGHILFFTGSEKEVRSWSIPAGTDAVTAAGQIHTDMARGFIRAETIAYEDLRRLAAAHTVVSPVVARSPDRATVDRATADRAAAALFHEVKAHGLLRLEGRHYIIHDADFILFRFSV